MLLLLLLLLFFSFCEHNKSEQLSSFNKTQTTISQMHFPRRSDVLLRDRCPSIQPSDPGSTPVACCINTITVIDRALTIFGVDPLGQSVAIQVVGFRPSFLCPAPFLVKNQLDAEQWLQEMEEKWEVEYPGFSSKKQETPFFRVIYEHHIPLIGFTNRRQDAMMRIFCRDIPSFQKLIREKFIPSHMEETVLLYHTEFEFHTQFLHQTGLQYRDWLDLSDNVIRSSRYASSDFNVDHFFQVPVSKCCKTENPCFKQISVPLLKCTIRLKAVSQQAVTEKKDDERKGAKGEKSRKEFHPQAKNPSDVIVVISTSFTWDHDTDQKTIYEHTLTTLPVPGVSIPTDSDSKKVVESISFYINETSLLASFRDLILSMDPDVLCYFPDYHNTFHYICERSVFRDKDVTRKYGTLQCSLLNWDRKKNVSVQWSKQGVGSHEHYHDKTTQHNLFYEKHRFSLAGRSWMDMQKALMKKVQVQVEKYELYFVSSIKKFRRVPLKPCSGKARLRQCPHQPNVWMRHPRFFKNIILQAMFERDLIRQLEIDNGSVSEYAENGRVTDIDITSAVSRGVEYPSMRAVQRECHLRHTYINSEKLAQKPLRFDHNDSKYGLTYRDPPELKLNRDFRNRCRQSLIYKRDYHKMNPMERDICRKALRENRNIPFILSIKEANKERLKHSKSNLERFEQFSKRQKLKEEEEKRQGTTEEEEENEEEFDDLLLMDNDDDDDDDDSEGGMNKVEGGNVLVPCWDFYCDPTHDISLLDFASLYPNIMMATMICYQTIVYDRAYLDIPGVPYQFIPAFKNHSVCIVLDEEAVLPNLQRKLVNNRKLAKREMNDASDPFVKGRLNLKQLALKLCGNGLYGFIGSKTSPIGVTELMYAVTAMGRFYQKTCSDYVGTEYAFPTIYGDTDSIFVLMQHDPTQSLEEIAVNMGKRCKMNGDFDWSYVRHEIMTRTDKMGDPYFFDFHPTEKDGEGRSKKIHLSDPDTWTLPEKIRAIKYLCAEVICVRLSDLFPKSIEMEFENMMTHLLLLNAKKAYTGYAWDPMNPCRLEKVKVTGLSKRDICPYIRDILAKVREFILSNEMDKIEPFLEERTEKMMKRQVPVSGLTISKLFKGFDKYDDKPTIQMEFAKDLSRRMNETIEPQRVLYVVRKANTKGEKTAYRALDPVEAELHPEKIDISFYFTNQLANPLKKLLIFHPEKIHVDQLIASYVSKVEMIEQGISTTWYEKMVPAHSSLLLSAHEK